MSMTPEQGRERGKEKAERGIKAAAYNHKWDINRDQQAVLKLFFADPSRTVTSDDTVENLAKKHKDGGKWRGEVMKGLARLNIIRRVGFTDSCRSSRNAGTVRVWELADINAAREYALELELYFLENPDRPTDPNDDEVDFASMTFHCCFNNYASPVSSPDDQNETAGAAV